MNGADTADRVLKTPAQAQAVQGAVQFLEAALKRARDGRVEAVFLVMVSPLGEITPCGVGARLAEINIGLDMGKGLILQTMTRPGPQILRG